MIQNRHNQTAQSGVGTVEGQDSSQRPVDFMYGASRVFDLFTLMAITLAFALLFAILNFLAPAFEGSPAAVTCGISGYVVLIALAQMFLYDGKNPRLASVVAGPVVMLLILAASWSLSGEPHFILAMILSLCSSVTFGFFTGYLAGAVIAGVFLVADAMRGRYNPSTPASDSPRDLSFDEIE